jgi:hypothetical protein
MPALAKLVDSRSSDVALVARFAGYFCGLKVVGTEGETAYLAAQDGSVFSEHQDEWRLVFDRTRTKKRGGPDKPRPDIKALKKRVEWLVEVFLGISIDSKTALEAAGRYSDWEKERSTAAKEPHFAAYWTVSHWLLGNTDGFEAARTMCVKARDPVARELGRMLGSGVDSTPTPTGGAKLAARLVSERVRVRATAPSKLFAPASQKTRALQEKTLDAESLDEGAAWQRLVDDKHPRTRQALKHLEDLKARAGVDPYSELRGPDRWDVITQFAECVDARWLPVLKPLYDRQASRPDVHKKVVPGVVLGLAVASGSLEAFFAGAPPSSTAAFKYERQLEYALGVARFAPDPRAMKWLTSRAEERIRRVNEWDVPFNAAYEALLRTNTPQARSAVERVLNAKDVHGGNWSLLTEAAIAAGRIGAKNALSGVKRFYERLRNDDDRKRQVKKALSALQAGRTVV